MGRRKPFLLLTVLLAMPCIAACSGSQSSPASPIAALPSGIASDSRTTLSADASTSSSTLKLGAFVHPDPAASPGLSSIDSLQDALGRKIDFDVHYYWITYDFPGADLDADAANGRTPIVSLDCSGYTNADIAAGKHDAAIDTMATALKNYGHPVIIRYLWEMNSPISSNHRDGCAGPDDTDNRFDPEDFIAAWDHLQSRFAAMDATNVKWFWCPNDSSKTLPAYFPGIAHVDDVGVDVYERPPDTFKSYASHVRALYDSIEDLAPDKPFVVGETGSQTADQVTFFHSLNSLFASLPAVTGWVYFDSSGPLGDWRVKPDTSQFAAFKAM